MSKITAHAQSKKSRPAKPYDGFPLYPHGTGRWAKKIRKKVYYFGPWDEPEAALKEFNRQRDYLYAGELPPAKDEDARGPTVVDLCNQYMHALERRFEAGEISSRTVKDMRETTITILSQFGAGRSIASVRPGDFGKLRDAIAKRRKSLGSRGNEINRVRMVFKWGFDNRLFPTPVDFGTEFRRPTKRVLRIAKAVKGEQLIEAAEIRKLLRHAPPALRAMILLGVNCGLGNADCGRLEHKHLDRKKSILDFPRPKTGIARRSKLWPITLSAIEKAEARERRRERQNPIGEDAVGKVFVTQRGRAWFRENKAESPVSLAFGKLVRATKVHRDGMGFYWLRRSCETIGGECGDQVAVDLVMGHVDTSMGATYRQRISDDRLDKVATTIHDWLWPSPTVTEG